MFQNFEIQRQLDSLIFDYEIDPEIVFEGVSSDNVNSKIYNALDLITIANNLSIDAVSLSNGEFCKKQVYKSVMKNGEVVSPDHLLESAFSSTTSLNSLLEAARPFGRREYLLKKLQVQESYLSEHRPLSVLACGRALEIMGPFFTAEVLRSIGTNNAKKFCSGPFGEAMTLYDSLTNSLENFVENSKLIEKNWDYKIVKREGSDLLVETTESELMREHMEGKPFTTTSMNIWRSSFLQEILRINSFQKVKCVSSIASKHTSYIKVSVG